MTDIITMIDNVITLITMIDTITRSVHQ